MYSIEYESKQFPLWKPNFVKLHYNKTITILTHINRITYFPKDIRKYLMYLVLKHENQLLGHWSESNKHW